MFEGLKKDIREIIAEPKKKKRKRRTKKQMEIDRLKEQNKLTGLETTKTTDEQNETEEKETKDILSNPTEETTQNTVFEDYEQENPPLGKRRKNIVFTQKEINDSFKQPVLFLIQPNGEVQIIEDVSTGAFEMEYKEKIHRLELSRNKLLSFKWGAGSLMGWVAYLGESTPYPLDVEHDSRELQRVILSLSQNYKNLESARINSWSKLIMYSLIGLGVLMAIIYIFGDGALPTI